MFTLYVNLEKKELCKRLKGSISFYEFDNGLLWLDGEIKDDITRSSVFEKNKNYQGVYNLFFFSFSDKRFFIKNDPLGQRPLYFYQNGINIYFGSCFWDVLSYSDIRNKDPLNLEAYNSLFYFRRIVPSYATLHSDIFCLPAGASCTFLPTGFSINHEFGMQQKEDLSLNVRDAAEILNDNIVINLHEKAKILGASSFWFGNSGGLDSRIIPSIAKKNNLECEGFLVSHNRFSWLDNQSKKASKKISQLYGIETKYIDFKSGEYNKQIVRDMLVNPFGPADFHKNGSFYSFSGSLVVNGGNSFILTNDGNSWLKHINMTGYHALSSYSASILKRSFLQEPSAGKKVYYESIKNEISSVVDLEDDFSVCRTLHQKYLNKTSPMGAFESMSWAGDFHYIYYSGFKDLYLDWPKNIFFNREVQKELITRFYPEVLSISDQGGGFLNRRKKSILDKVLQKLRGNGLLYHNWVKSDWFITCFNFVKNKEIVRDSEKASELLKQVENLSSAQDKLDFVKLAFVVAVIESGEGARSLEET